ncbi:MAG: S1 RNA-binding domain-containing protein [Lachnospiraceae bacterium]|nr:S1 RNA-binding domain-containing protein [Lachnospiraceae bacterium]
MEENRPEEVLLPRKQVPENAAVGDEVEVFLYRDSNDRMIATVNKPLIRLHEVALLTVKETAKIGAFLDMGLERDLLLPFREQLYPLEEGDKALVTMYIDKSGRLAATTRVYHYLKAGSPYEKDDEVEGLLYEVSEKFGAFVAVDYRYSGLIPAKDFSHEAKPGDLVAARVVAVKEDGRLDLSLRKKAWLQMDDDSEAILALMKDRGGFLPFTDKADPELIRDTCHMSKNAFKRAVGHLMKQGLVRIEPSQIVCVESK